MGIEFNNGTLFMMDQNDKQFKLGIARDMSRNPLFDVTNI